jgi:hypothetical protein
MSSHNLEGREKLGDLTNNNLMSAPRIMNSTTSFASNFSSLKGSASNISANSTASRSSLSSLSPVQSTTNLVRKMLTIDDIKIVINEEQLNEFRENVMKMFQEKVIFHNFFKIPHPLSPPQVLKYFLLCLK